MNSLFLFIPLILPFIVGIILFTVHLSPRDALKINIGTQFLVFCSSLYFLHLLADAPQILFLESWLRLDSLSAFYFFMTSLASFLISLFARFYFAKESLSPSSLKRFLSLWSLTMTAGSLVLFANNIALMWVALEATTIFSAFLICAQKTRANLEAMWKYLILCTIGVAFAFIGTILIRVSAQNLSVPSHDILLWSTLYEYAPLLQTGFLKAGFIFLLVGYGTKAGMAPMHTWMPDAYSSAPAPLGALSSGVIINLAIYSLSRFLPLAEKATVFSGWARELLVIMGGITIVVAVAFICFQHNIKRLLAYSSIEHIGIVTIALGLPGAGLFASLYHSLGHALTKSLAFFCAGKMRQLYGTLEIKKIRSTTQVSPLWGLAFLLSLMALIGVAPFSIFMSKFLIFKSLVHEKSWVTLVILAVGSSLVFISVLRYALAMTWKKGEKLPPAEKENPYEKILLVILLSLLILLCFWLPEDLRVNIENAARILAGEK